MIPCRRCQINSHAVSCTSPIKKQNKLPLRRKIIHDLLHLTCNQAITSSIQQRRLVSSSVGFLTPHLSPQSCWLRHSVILSSAQPSHHKQYPTTAFGQLICWIFDSASVPSVMLAKTKRHPFFSTTKPSQVVSNNGIWSAHLLDF